MIPNTKGLKVLTPTGFQDFAGIANMGEKATVTITTVNGLTLEATPNHKVLGGLGLVEVMNLKEGDTIQVAHGIDCVKTLEHHNNCVPVYDLIEVDGGHLFFTNGVVSHNCEFVSSDALLIDTIFLQSMKEVEPIREVREFKFWDSIYPENAYIVTVDPATGTGCDYSNIDVFHFPSLNQVAQFRSNSLNTPQLYAKLKWVLKGLESKKCEAYFTIENNGVGEGLIALYQADENPPTDAIFVGDETKREGMNTQGRSKLRSCIMFKELLESGVVTVNSAQSIRELKSFVRKAGSYQAQVGATDDCVSCLLLLARVLNEISAYDTDAFEKVYRMTDDGTVYHIADKESLVNDQL